MTSKDKDKLKAIELAPSDLRALCWKYRKEHNKENWFFLSKCGVQSLQLNRFLDEDKGISTSTMSRIANWLIKNV